MKYLLALLCLALITLISACDNGTTLSTDAIKSSIPELNKEPGFGWFLEEVNSYSPDTVSINKIKLNFNPQTDKFLIFVKPSCTCYGTTKMFPAFYKSLQKAGVSDSNMELYRMNSHTDKNPYIGVIDILDLPRFFLVRNGVIKYSVVDSLDSYVKNFPKDSTFRIENAVANSLK